MVQRARIGSRAVLAVILVSYLMIVLDISVVIAALPRIRETLGFSPEGLSWVQNAYTLAFGGLLLLGARAGDLMGRKKMFLAGVWIFAMASLGIGLSSTPLLLIGFRALQGTGAAILAPSTLALLSTNFQGAARTRAVAMYGAVAGIGASLGLVMGGILTDLISWRAGFFVNLPIGAFLVVAASRSLTETDRHSGRFDLWGALFSTLGMGTLVYGLVRSASEGWSDSVVRLAVGGGLAFLTIFVFNERGASQPLVPLRLFASRERSGAYAARMLFLGAMMGFWFFTTQYLQVVMGFSPFQAGLAFLPMTLVNFAVALAVPRLTVRWGNGALLGAGLVLSALGMAWLSRLGADASYATSIALPMLLIGAGQGATLSPLTVAGISGARPSDAGAASGLVNVAHQLGGSLGLGALVAVSAIATHDDVDSKFALTHRVSVAIATGTGMLAIAFVLVVILIVRPGVEAVVGEREVLTENV